ncbi:hypothetical protein [Sphingopyxis sp.]|uniref:hypothetical protein n=1 Tax=Sphingopyxis sp. TaxID=1908224 RepID=UPI002ED8BECD
MFCAQFEPDGDGFLYRAGLKAEAVRVSAQERQAFVDAFRRDLRRMMVSTIGIIVAIAIAMIAWEANHEAIDRNSLTYWAIIASLTVPLVLAHLYIWRAPARALERRPKAGPPLSRKDIGDRILVEQSYGFHVATLLIFSTLLFASLSVPDPFRGWNLVWLGTWVALILVSIANLYRKWKLSRPG